MEKTALIFPGQGSQTKGMGKSFYDAYASARAVFQTGEKVLGRSLTELCFETEDETLSKTLNSQPAIFAVSMAMLAVLKEKGFPFDGVCGHSLGEVSALTAAGIFDLTEGFITIFHRAKAMNEAAEHSQGGMAAIIGLEAETVESVCKDTTGYVIPVNYNCPKQIVIAGEESALEEAMESCMKLKALKVVRLAVSAAFHSNLMEEASESLYRQIQGIQTNVSACEVYSNLNGDKMAKNTDVPAYLRKQMTSPVQFEKSVRKMIENGYTNFLEVGSGRVLSGLVKRIDRGVKILNIEDFL